MSKGWVVAVESAKGDLLYVVATESADDAEQIVVKNLSLSGDQFVRVVFPATDDQLTAFGLTSGAMKGPM